MSQQTAKAPTVAARAAAPAAAAPTKSMDGSGSYWVQVGLFENAANAERLAQGLRTDRFSVQVAQVSRGSGTPAAARHELFVTGSSVDAVSAALKGSGTAQAVTGGVRIQPALDLKDAVTLSRRLASEGPGGAHPPGRRPRPAAARPPSTWSAWGATPRPPRRRRARRRSPPRASPASSPRGRRSDRPARGARDHAQPGRRPRARPGAGGRAPRRLRERAARPHVDLSLGRPARGGGGVPAR